MVRVINAEAQTNSARDIIRLASIDVDIQIGNTAGAVWTEATRTMPKKKFKCQPKLSKSL